MNERRTLVIVAVVLLAAGALAAEVDLRELGSDVAGPRAQVLVLGSVHLSQERIEGATRGSLEPLLERLAAFAPDVIAVESIPGEACDHMARHPALYGPAEDNPYCRDPAAARAATGLDLASAVAAVHETLASWPATPTPAQRRRLAALLLAAGDPASGLVQWWRLPADERRAGDGLDQPLVALLETAAVDDNERYQIAARLASRLGLESLHPIDDHTGDSLDVTDEAAFAGAVQAAWDAAAAAVAPARDRVAAQWRSGDMLALYREVNSDGYLRAATAADFGAALRDPSPQQFGRQYVAGWETRNLRMAANIRAAFRERVGARVLVIVGASHKPWLDSLLGQMQGVDVVDVDAVLATEPADPSTTSPTQTP